VAGTEARRGCGYRVQRRGDRRGGLHAQGLSRPGTDKLTGVAREERGGALQRARGGKQRGGCEVTVGGCARPRRHRRHGRRAGLLPKTERGGGCTALASGREQKQQERESRSVRTYPSMPTVAAGSSDPRNTCMESSRVGSAQSACFAVAIIAAAAAASATPAGSARAERGMEAGGVRAAGIDCWWVDLSL
jgi:hypothetical protein